MYNMGIVGEQELVIRPQPKSHQAEMMQSMLRPKEYTFLELRAQAAQVPGALSEGISVGR